MANSSSLKYENKQHTCYFAMAAWLFNYCHSFSDSSKNRVSMIKVRSLEDRGK